ncbi:unnamed protein product [Durusdinium trenchii]|uniref:Uncharacterized protein n=1 Tax=Durusdinium trenchii TaxID=1381693 RepID=A0ABP0PXR6_9DINO
MALLSVLFLRHGFHDKTSDWEARCYLLLLPVLSLVDVMAGLLAYAAMLNPLRADTLHQLLSSSWYADPESCCCFDSEVQSAARWNAHLRGIAIKTGLASLMDFLLFPVGLVLGLTVYRAGPLLKALWGYDELGEPILEESLPISRIHAIIMKQFALLLLDLLTLPSLILVLLTGYRCSATQHLMERMRARNYGAMAYHVAVVSNSLVIMHDAFLAVCSLTLLLTVYRLPRVIRVLQRQGVSSDSDSGSESDSSTSSSSRMRLKIWQEIGHLLLDLPLLPLLLILLLTVWRADLVLQEIWHAESDCEGRKVVALQFLELLRDMLAFVALLILAVTLVRLPKVLLDIYAQRARPATGTPRLALRSVQVAAPNDDRLTWYVAADQESSRKRNELGVIRINVISQAFWEDIGRVFGTAVSSLGKALLPYTLQEGKHFEYNDLLPQAVQMELKIGGDELKKRLLQLDGDMTMCVQIEHRAPDGTEEVMGRLPIPARVLHDAIRRPETVVQVPEEFIAAARSPDLLEAVCGPLLSGSGIRNGLWICAFRELWQLVLDLLHLLLFLLLLASPLRLMQYLYFAGSSNQAWLRKLTRQMVSVLYLKDSMLRMYRGLGLEPALNAAAKDPPSRTRTDLQVWLT